MFYCVYTTLLLVVVLCTSYTASLYINDIDDEKFLTSVEKNLRAIHTKFADERAKQAVLNKDGNNEEDLMKLKFQSKNKEDEDENDYFVPEQNGYLLHDYYIRLSKKFPRLDFDLLRQKLIDDVNALEDGGTKSEKNKNMFKNNANLFSLDFEADGIVLKDDEDDDDADDDNDDDNDDAGNEEKDSEDGED
ncbi:coiled-coil domain-containing protein 1-like [Hydractinia symbiolongicarpus]|uniref:coiled-coil domain-containing protein 1-like n=1 Tax=Hydractinia symbiolongicarpus TaxID=13093 RepID=UPI00254BB89F|nr:coiled-coil domain-containing protein 1-like [Hydractinia symbiolongicarpus]